MTQPLAWDDFRLVKAIADARSLGGAAEALTVNNSTVFRRLNTLEDQLGVRIFERARTGYMLTSAGEEMVALATRMSESIIEFERRIAGQDVRPSGELRVTTTDTMFSDLIAPAFCGFRDKFPEILLDFVIDNRPLNLSRRDADVAIRAAVDPPETLVGRRVGTIAWSAYASKAFIAQHGLDPKDAAGFLMPGIPWIGMSYPIHAMAPAKWLEDNIAPESLVAKVSAVSAAEDALLANIGAGILPCFMGAKSPSLVRIPLTPKADSGLWILTHPDLKKAARVRAFLDYFGQELTRQRRLLEGEEG
ncbi:MAG: LysR family transcriptional regulator [Rhabdaerophilum sp.]